MESVINNQSMRSFLESFSNQHHSWLVTVDTVTSRGADDPDIENLPLRKISRDDRGITIVAGDEEEQHVHRIESPTSLAVETIGEENAVAALRIASPAGETIVSLRTAIDPELIDELGG